MTTKKINLNDLKVKSFVTSLESKDSQTLKAGVTPAISVANVAVQAFISGIGIGIAATIIISVLEINSKNNEKNKSEKDQ